MTLQSSNAVAVINTATNRVVATVPVGSTPLGVAVHPAGTFVYVANHFSHSISVINTATNTVIKTIVLGSPTSPAAEGDFIGPIQVAKIRVDGDPCDWAGVPPLITDIAGNADPANPEDFISLYVTDDGMFVYFLLEFANAIRTNDSGFGLGVIYLDTDLNPGTGCPINAVPNEQGLGGEFILAFFVNFGSPAASFLGDVRDCGSTGSDLPAALAVAARGRFIEAAVPISTLRLLTPNLTGFRIRVAAEVYSGIAQYGLSKP